MFASRVIDYPSPASPRGPALRARAGADLHRHGLVRLTRSEDALGSLKRSTAGLDYPSPPRRATDYCAQFELSLFLQRAATHTAAHASLGRAAGGAKAAGMLTALRQLFGRPSSSARARAAPRKPRVPVAPGSLIWRNKTSKPEAGTAWLLPTAAERDAARLGALAEIAGAMC